MDTFISLLKVLRKSGPVAVGMRTTPAGPHDREMTISFRPGDQTSIDYVFAEPEGLGLKPRRSQDGLTLAAGINNTYDT